jgi:hypothetical protein
VIFPSALPQAGAQSAARSDKAKAFCLGAPLTLKRGALDVAQGRVEFHFPIPTRGSQTAVIPGYSQACRP